MDYIFQDLLFDVIQVLVALILVAGTAYLKKKIEGSPYEQAFKKLTKLVYDAEKEILGDKVGEERKIWVLNEISKFLKKKNINIDADTINEAIEDTVSIINILREEAGR